MDMIYDSPLVVSVVVILFVDANKKGYEMILFPLNNFKVLLRRTLGALVKYSSHTDRCQDSSEIGQKISFSILFGNYCCYNFLATSSTAATIFLQWDGFFGL